MRALSTRPVAPSCRLPTHRGFNYYGRESHETRIYLTPGHELTKGTLKGRTTPRHATPHLTSRRDLPLRHRAHTLYLRTVGRTYVAFARRSNDV